MPDTSHGERALWSEVLIVAFRDAARGATLTRLREDRHVSYHNAAAGRAQRYLTSPSRDLATVCSLAGVEMEKVIATAKEQPWYRGQRVVS